MPTVNSITPRFFRRKNADYLAFSLANTDGCAMFPVMESTALTLPDDIAELKQIIATWEDRYVKDTTFLREQIRLLRSQIFGRKSEKVMDCVVGPCRRICSG
jgi:hypothetical protein